jgi:tetratricopeptide (TPR) repeat protein
MNCQKCNKEITSESKFCKYCGAKNEQIPTTQPLNTSNAINNKTNKKSFDFRILGWVIFIIFIIIGAYYGSADDKAKENNQKALNILETSENKQDAITSLTEASQTISDTDDKITIIKNLAYAYIADNQKDNAISKFNEALALCEKYSFDYFLISGEIASLSGRLGDALAYYNKAHDIESENGQINTALCLFYSGNDDPNEIYVDYNKAVPFCQKAYEVNSDSEIAKENLALCYIYLKEFNKAISLLRTTSLDKKAINNYYLGLAYLGINDKVNAKIYFGKAISMGAEVEPEIYNFINE